MKFSCDKNIILEAVNHVIRTVPAKASVPVLEGLLLTVYKGGRLTVTGSDSELFIETSVSVDTVDDGALVVNAKLFYDMISKLENGTVLFRVDENGVMNIVSGLIKYKLPTMEASLYPQVPEIEKSESIKLKKSVLAGMLRQTLFSLSVKDTRPILKGALFDVKEEKISIVTSDTFRLAVRTEMLEEKRTKEFGFVVPGKALNELVKIMKNDDDPVYIGVASSHVVFEFEETKIVSRLLSGEFLKYQQMIPKQFKTTIRINTEDLKKSIERASVLVNEKVKNPVKISFEFDTVVVSYKTPDGSSMTDEVTAHIEGENFAIGFNDKYILDAMNYCEIPEVMINLNSPVSSICITPKDSEKFVFLISPMRLRD